MANFHVVLLGLALMFNVVHGLGAPGDGGRLQARAITTRYTTIWSNITSTIGGNVSSSYSTLYPGTGVHASGIFETRKGVTGTGGVGATGTGVGGVLPSGTGFGTIRTGIVRPSGTGSSRHKYTGTVGVAPVLSVTTVQSTVFVIPTPVRNGTHSARPNKVDAHINVYFADPLKDVIFHSAVETVSDAEPTTFSLRELDGDHSPDILNKRNKRETVQDALDRSRSELLKRVSTLRAGFMAHTKVFIRPEPINSVPGSHADTQVAVREFARLEFLKRDADAVLVSADYDANELEKRQSDVKPLKTKLHGDFTVGQGLESYANLPEGLNKKIGAGENPDMGGPEQATTLRRIKLALTRHVPTPTATADTETYGNQNPNMADMPTQVGIELDLSGVSFEVPKATGTEEAK